MKTFIAILTLTIISAAPAFAAPAVGYSCVGNNKVTGQAVSFDLTFSDYGNGEGYTNESITIGKKPWDDNSIDLVILQMHGATQKNNCQKNGQGEINMYGHFSMDPTEKGNFAPYKVSFKTDCLAAKKYDVQAYCFFD
ncbi:MAG: hypothetical protein ACXWQO_14175 [Bdellovibrionota bacterium]